MTDLFIRGQEEDLALATQLIADLPVQRFLDGFHRQEEVGPLLRAQRIRLDQHAVKIELTKKQLLLAKMLITHGI